MPSINYSVRIVNENGSGVKGRRVAVHYDFTHHDDFTDSDGWVSFTKDNMMHDFASATIYVDGDSQGQHTIRDGDTLSFTV